MTENQRNLFYVFVIVALSSLVYANSLQGEFLWDANTLIFNWPEIRNFQNIPLLLKGNIPPEHRGVYRPIRSLFYALSYRVWGMEAFGYHVIALFIHISGSVLTYFIILAILRAGGTLKEVSPKGITYRLRAEAVAVTGAILFCIHPVHTEAVTYIIASFDTIGIIFYLLSFYLYISAFSGGDFSTPVNDFIVGKTSREGGEPGVGISKSGYGLRLLRCRRERADPVAGEGLKAPELQEAGSKSLGQTCFSAIGRGYPLGSVWRWCMYTGSVIFACLGYFTYEMAVTLPAIIILYDFFFGRARKRFYLPYILLLGVYIYLRFVVAGVGARGEYFGGSFYITMLTMGKALMRYMRLLILPYGLNVNHELPGGILSLLYAERCEEELLSQSIFDVHVMGAIIFVISAIWIGMRLRRRVPEAGFSLYWVLIALLPVMNIVPLPNVMAERYLYLASVGSSFLTGYLIVKVMSDGKARRVLGVTLILFLFIFYARGTVLRNRDWKDEVSLWKATLREVPESAMANMNLGGAYCSASQPDKAKYYSIKALSLDPEDIKAYNNLSVAHYQLGEYSQAFGYCLKVLELNDTNYKAYNNLGLIYGALGEAEKEIDCYRESLRLKPSFTMARLNLSLSYHAKGLYELARDELEEVLKIEPYNITARGLLEELE